MPDSEHPWREDLEILRKKQSPLYDQIGALVSELNKARDKNKALKGWICALCTLTLLISVFWWTDHTEKAPASNYSSPNYSSVESDDKISQVKSLARTEGYQEGYSAGKDAGYQTGYDAGMADGVLASSEAYAEIANAWSDGYDSGYEQAAADLEAVAATTSSNTTQAPQVVETPAPVVTTYDYIINTRTGKFHYSWCSSVGQMKESNKWYYTGTHDEVVNMGYDPCQRCCP